MARMHSRKKGKSSSTKPIKKSVPSWIRYKPAEIELLIAKLSRQGKTPSQIGIYLRDVYGIPDVTLITKKTITKILEEKKLLSELPEDLMALIKKAVMIRKHQEENRQDQTAKRGLQLTESKIGRLVNYYKKNDRLDKAWKYDPERVSLFVE
ncbi:30S ribosomal protein S15 [Candidatus Woesearchaeota archaeon]|nr:30S ribosomal protein S15 [Candidatus Woesearchaeota archaeon]